MKIAVFTLLVLIMAGCNSGSQSKPDLQTKTDGVNVAVPEVKEEVPQPIPADQMLSPLQSIKDLDGKLDSFNTSAELTPAEAEKNRELKKKILSGTFDIYELSRLSLDVHWEPLTGKERRFFADLMTDLLEKKAIFSKEQVKGGNKPYRVDYKTEQFKNAEKSLALVTTILYVPSEKIDLNINYHLKKTPYGWKIYDVIVDDASLVENYKFQFDTIIKKYGYPDLIARMEKKLKDMK